MGGVLGVRMKTEKQCNTCYSNGMFNCYNRKVKGFITTCSQKLQMCKKLLYLNPIATECTGEKPKRSRNMRPNNLEK